MCFATVSITAADNSSSPTGCSEVPGVGAGSGDGELDGLGDGELVGSGLGLGEGVGVWSAAGLASNLGAVAGLEVGSVTFHSSPTTPPISESSGEM